MIAVARTDNSVVGRWWWTVDHWMLGAVLLLAALGAILVMAASPAIAQRFDVDAFYFVRRQLVVLGPALAVMFLVSLASPVAVRRTPSTIQISAPPPMANPRSNRPP